MSTERPGIDVIVRFHDVKRIRELVRAIFSLYGQEFRPLNVLLVLQRFSDQEEQAVRDALNPILSLPDPIRLAIVRFDAALPIDARSALVNSGFENASSRYLAILDYDDVLYPEAYRMLVERLETSGAAIAFGGIWVKSVDLFPKFVHACSQSVPFKGEDLSDLFLSNFCPIHSFVVDCDRAPLNELKFEENISIEEDYEFLLRLCSKVRSDFGLREIKLGEYYYKSDESNTVASRILIPEAVKQSIKTAAMFIQARRQMLLISEEVQDQLGLPEYRPGLTIADYLAER